MELSLSNKKIILNLIVKFDSISLFDYYYFEDWTSSKKENQTDWLIK